MRFLLLNQTFHPDVMATGQYLSDVAKALVRRGHRVTVVTSRRAYDDPSTCFRDRELWDGVHVYRVACSAFGKGAKWRRALDFATFLVSCCLRLITLPRPDAVLALTTPPLISFVAAVYASLRRCRFYYWVMDFNPDEAIAAGWLRAQSPLAWTLESLSRFSLRRATQIIALDRFMRDRILAKSIAANRVTIISPWSHDEQVSFDATGREKFREQHGLQNKFVVMYSGNHSPVHPLNTLLEAARRSADDPEIVFCFVGGGSEWRQIRTLISSDRSLSSLKCLPYQPLSSLSAALSAADVHVVVMGNAMLGLVHPCKIYNILAVGTPVLYIGPQPSHITDLLKTGGAGQGSHPCHWACAHHGDVGQVLQALSHFRRNAEPRAAASHSLEPWSKANSLPRLVDLLQQS